MTLLLIIFLKQRARKCFVYVCFFCPPPIIYHMEHEHSVMAINWWYEGPPVLHALASGDILQ